MNYVWEEDFDIFAQDVPRSLIWHLKHVIPQPALDRFWKVSLAWITRDGERTYKVRFAQHDNNDKTFRSLKAAKAYALAIVTLEQ